jgi:hypothetical protein
VLEVHHALLRWSLEANQPESLFRLRELRHTKRIDYGHRVHRSNVRAVSCGFAAEFVLQHGQCTCTLRAHLPPAC